MDLEFVSGRLQTKVVSITADEAELHVWIEDDKGQPMIAFPATKVKSGATLTIQPVLLVPGAGGNPRDWTVHMVLPYGATLQSREDKPNGE